MLLSYHGNHTNHINHSSEEIASAARSYKEVEL